MGKTVLLKHLAAKLKDAIFISVDTLDQEHDLFATVKLLKENFHYQHYSLDEVYSQKTPDYLLDDRRFRKTVNKIGSNSKGREMPESSPQIDSDRNPSAKQSTRGLGNI